MEELDIPSIIEKLGGVEEINKGLDKFKNNISFFRSNQSSFLKKYPHKWIAIQDEGVVATSKSLKGLMSVLKKGEIDTGTCYIQFLDPNPKPQILTAIQARDALAFFIPQNYIIVTKNSFPPQTISSKVFHPRTLRATA